MQNLPEPDPADGVSLAQRPKGKIKPGQDMSLPAFPRKGYGVGTLRGQAAYTNGYFLLVGTTDKPTEEDMRDRFDHITPAPDGEGMRPIGFTAAGEMPLVWFADGGAMNAGIFDRIAKAYPNALFHRKRDLPSKRGKNFAGPYTVTSAGQLVGLAMPVSTQLFGAPSNLRPFFEAGPLELLDRATIDEANRALAVAETDVKLSLKLIKQIEFSLATELSAKNRKREERRLVEATAALAREHQTIAMAKAMIEKVQAFHAR